MASANGTAILNFPADAQAAQFETAQDITDYAPITWTGKGSIVGIVDHLIYAADLNGGTLATITRAGVSAVSTDNGNTWTTGSLPAGGANVWRCLQYGNGVFIALLSNTTTAASSTDGINWTARTLPSAGNWAAAGYGNGIFVALPSTSAAAARSTDGINWTSSTLPISTVQWGNVVWGTGIFVAVGQTTTTSIRSEDGITWTTGTLPSSNAWRGLAYGRGVFIAVAAVSNAAAYSTNGTTWTSTTMPSSSQWQTATYGDGLFIAATVSPFVLAQSINGINWTTVNTNLATNNSFISLGYTGSLVFATTNGGGIWSAKQGRAITNVNIETSPYKPVVGSNVATVTVTGQTSLLATDHIDAWIQASDDTYYGLLLSFGSWTLGGAIRTLSSKIAPDGTASVYTLTDNSAVGYEVKRSGVLPATSGEYVVFSVHIAKDAIAKTTRFAMIRLLGIGVAGSHVCDACLDTSTGEVVKATAGAFVTYSNVGVEDKGSYWRVWTAIQITDATLTGYYADVYPAVGNGATLGFATYFVTTTGSIDVWAPQLDKGVITPNNYPSNHNAYEHKIAPIKLAVMNVVAGTGFDIVGLSEHRLDGAFKVRWAWAT